jgi:D-inositol-3-phosphate glycosyltransferase
MKIAIIDPVGIKAGMNCYDLGLLNALNKKDVQVFLFSNFTDKNFTRVKQFNYFLIQKTNVAKVTLNYISSYIKAIIKCKNAGVTWIVLHVFHTTSKVFFPFFLIKLFRFKIIAIMHDVSSLTKEDNSLLRKEIYRLSTILVVHNETSKKSIELELREQEKKKLRVISHGNFSEFIFPNTKDCSESFQINSNYKYLLFFGQIKKVKGLDVFLKAVPLLSDKFKIIIAGRPQKDDFSYYENIIQELKIEDRVIKVIRFITDEERDFLFKNCHALILPYRKIFQSGVLLLSMSYGLPVIASDLAANREVIINNKNGILFEDGNYLDLADKIERLFSDNLIEKIKTNTFSTVQDRYSWSKISDEYQKILVG